MKKIEKIVVACLALFPFAFIVLFFIARIGQGTEQFSTMQSAFEQVYLVSNGWKMRALSEPLYQLLGELQVDSLVRMFLTNLFSYEGLILILHIGFQALMFIPKFFILLYERVERKCDK